MPQEWIVLSSSSGQTFQALFQNLSEDARQSLRGAFCDRDCGAWASFQGLEQTIQRAFWPKISFEQELLNWIDQHKFRGLIFLCGFFKILSPAFFVACPCVVVNTHPSLLPSFPGLDKKVHQQATSQVAVSGFTVHLVDQNLDSGTVLFQHPFFLDPNKTPDDLRQELRAVEQKWLPVFWERILFSKLALEDGALDSHELRRKHAFVINSFHESKND